MINIAPDNEEVEVTIIGTGGGYGETVLIKIGIDSWIIVDSCINPTTKEPLAIQYLKDLGVDFGKVFLVVCTHWHNDHIMGLARVLSLCPNAELSFSCVTDINKFLRLCELDGFKASRGSISSTEEFARCLKIVSDRGTYFTKASSNMVLTSKYVNNVEFLLFALTPSPKTVSDFDSELSELITEFGKRNTAVIKKSPNDKSVALLLKFGNHRVLLGADLECGKTDAEGWRYVVKHSKVIDNTKASIYKVPHHGSENGYLDSIFDVLVDKDSSILKISPFSPSGLPKPDMLEKYSMNSDSIYITSRLNVSKKPKQRDRNIEKIISRTAIYLMEVKYMYGVVRSRVNYKSSDAKWETASFFSAFKYVKGATLD